ncbi:tetratricopeptide repeat protein [Vibrio vulnificus]|nr:tetratricopeptide repeat protein [Vibrio vulnificus]EIZ1408506.1 tetratricopeptide repeat protein [Vibrio vulnificus]EIZ1412275.1 tetratricopeptide repeat protein [Vibrio vulnificus]EJA3293451.1 tetratricopeptide repeat protein [Vibrio vulnificus]EJA3297145.1 tetratricopeptide repeat protein [Vibrio vulnificus]
MSYSEFTSKELFHLAIESASQKRSDNTLRYLKELVSREPDHIDALFLTGAAYATIGMFEEAVEYLERTVSIDPDFFIARFQLGISLLAMAKPDEGCMNFEHICNSKCPTYLKFFSKGLIYSQKNDKDKAIELLEKGIESSENKALSSDMEGVIEALKNMPAESFNDQIIESEYAYSEDILKSSEFLIDAYKIQG